MIDGRLMEEGGKVHGRNEGEVHIRLPACQWVAAEDKGFHKLVRAPYIGIDGSLMED